MKSQTEGWADVIRNGSKSFKAMNPHLVAPNGGSGKTKSIAGILKPRRGTMNKTEAEFALMLEARKRAGEILRYEFEGLTLRWANMRYTPDFVVFESQMTITSFETEDCSPDVKKHFRIKLIEVKGGHIWDRDIVRFKGARAYWPEFSFEMMQKTKNGWVRKF